MAHPLDKLIWTALTTRQPHLSEGDERARRFQTDIGPFAAALDTSAESVASLAAIIPNAGDISLLEPSPPAAPNNVEVSFTAPGVQMITRAFASGGAKDLPIEPLGDADA